MEARQSKRAVDATAARLGDAIEQFFIAHAGVQGAIDAAQSEGKKQQARVKRLSDRSDELIKDFSYRTTTAAIVGIVATFVLYMAARIAFPNREGGPARNRTRFVGVGRGPTLRSRASRWRTTPKVSRATTEQ